MYGKLMSISDEMMWRYYELLTDVQVAEIESYKRLQHPMESKKELASRIVRDFHSAEAAIAASESWTRQFQFRQAPQTLEQTQVNYEEIAAGWSPGTPTPADAPIKVDKLVQKVGLASSVTEASKKRTQRAVKIDDVVVLDPIFLLRALPKSLTLQLGRKYIQVFVRGALAP
jgi:tyrosyl-tRNA synthetase